RTRFLMPTELSMPIRPFPRLRLGDGSLFLVDAAGHMAGHVNMFARTSTDGSWIYLQRHRWGSARSANPWSYDLRSCRHIEQLRR
ncbi:hypothetical protein C8F04DRAFT_973306, partial [Mycena alexandri]